VHNQRGDNGLSANPFVVRDDLGTEIVFDGPPRRIVSLVPSMTETVIDLGAAERLVGVTRYCVHPAEVVARLPQVGGTKGFSFERIAALKPDLILANKEENRKHQVDKLRAAYRVFVSYPRTVEESIGMVRSLGTLTGRSAQATEFAGAVDQVLGSMETSIVARPLRTACMIWHEPWMAAGAETYMNALLTRVGFVNVFDAGDGRYPKTTLSEIVERKPDLVILPDEPYAFAAKDKEHLDAFLQDHGSRTRVLLFDGSLLTWFGTRTLKGLQALYDAKRQLA
jgi:ABC-type Fe3+-hydroxamate transport system substrate-binding protein